MNRLGPKGLAIFLIATTCGCASSSSSSSPLAIPAAVPALGSAKASETTYTGVLVHVHPGAGPQSGWKIRNFNGSASLPLDVTKVVATARELSGKQVVVIAHTAAEPGGKLMLKADTLAASN
jgi:hypothetical protein